MSYNIRRAVAYYRTSSASNVGADKDSDKRQKDACLAYAAGADIEIAREFYDAAVSGADPIDARPAFINMLAWCRENDIDLIIVENASRFARDLVVQLTGHDMLRDMGIELIPADAPDYFTDDTPTATMVRQILGAVSQFEKASLVAKLKAARDRKRAATGKCEGRKSWAEINPDLVKTAKRLARKNPSTGRKRSLRQISAELAAAGYVNGRGNPFQAAAVKRLISGTHNI
jgi:DNA invertase Pin-like site-specific DNA recombinase